MPRLLLWFVSLLVFVPLTPLAALAAFDPARFNAFSEPPVGNDGGDEQGTIVDFTFPVPDTPDPAFLAELMPGPHAGSAPPVFQPPPQADPGFDPQPPDSNTPAVNTGSAPVPATPAAAVPGQVDMSESSGSFDAPVDAGELERLKQRVEELEKARIADEDATRWIIRDAVSTLGSKINEFVALGGTLEVLSGGAQVFQGQSERVLRLSTAQLDFEIKANDWTLGSIIVEYLDGKDTLFVTNEGSEESVDRINLDTAVLTIGDTQRFPPFLQAGRMIVPFGISTGDPVADVPTIEDPLTLEAFETKEEAILFGIGLPTPPLAPPPPPVSPPPVRPLVVNPIFSSLSRLLGYRPPPRPPPLPTFTTPTPQPPPFTGGFYLYNGDTQRDPLGRVNRNWRPSENFGATLGFRTRGHCGRPYEQLRGSPFCPWSIGINVNYIDSVFDSLFLESEYRPFLGQISFVPGMAGSVKSTLGPVGLVAEWNGAIKNATFADDLGTPVNIRPRAWQLSLAYQFDWNPWVEAIAAQGTYLALGYSESRDLAGVTRVINGANNRVGAVPKRRFLVSVGEWVLGGLRVAVEYTYNVDYEKNEGGTGNTAHGVFSQLTYEW